MRSAAAALDAPDAREPAGFSLRLLPGRAVRPGQDGPDWVHIRPPGGGRGLSFRTEPACLPPVRPRDGLRPGLRHARGETGAVRHG
jgi:hypothetical protein